ncbi:unnamed protein product [Trifolium pratense]|uniref:Uncharacterized protein n=1 Tax=Trifolium pratense TaxID=57577 RepID=A0ACB0J2A5_TRIPR|nr:unnamed protein product [Trifolium pratense]
MGLEIFDEFRPITPIRTNIAPMTKTLKHVSQQDTTKKNILKDDEQECQTPTSSKVQKNNFFVCPPAPKKARVTRRNNSAQPSQGFFQVPHDLASVFVFRSATKLPRRSEIYSS